MCAVDALGIPAMLDEPATVRSSDPANDMTLAEAAERGRRIFGAALRGR
jgi:hypothetical protein